MEGAGPRSRSGTIVDNDHRVKGDEASVSGALGSDNGVRRCSRVP